MSITDKIKKNLENLTVGKNLPCLVCGKEELKNPIFDKNLGGPYCSADCLEKAGFDAMLDARYIL